MWTWSKYIIVSNAFRTMITAGTELMIPNPWIRDKLHFNTNINWITRFAAILGAFPVLAETVLKEMPVGCCSNRSFGHKCRVWIPTAHRRQLTHFQQFHQKIRKYNSSPGMCGFFLIWLLLRWSLRKKSEFQRFLLLVLFLSVEKGYSRISSLELWGQKQNDTQYFFPVTTSAPKAEETLALGMVFHFTQIPIPRSHFSLKFLFTQPT